MGCADARSLDELAFAQSKPLRELVEGATIPVEEYAEDDLHVLMAELPGIDPDTDVDVHVRDGVLHIRAERRQRTRPTRLTSAAKRSATPASPPTSRYRPAAPNRTSRPSTTTAC